MIKLIESEDYKRCYDVIVASFKGVSEALNATPENCPGNSAFMSYNRFLNMTKKMNLYGYYDENLIGCVGLIKKSDVSYKVKMLSVLPSKRHQGIGQQLMDYVTEHSAGKLKLGMIYENKKLYKWYLNLGFETEKIVSYKGNDFHVAYMEKRIEANLQSKNI